MNQFFAQIETFSHPQIILWYIGCSGFRKMGAHFYRDQILSPLFTQHPQAEFWLTDLTAWNAFKLSTASIETTNRCLDKIQAFQLPRIHCISSATILHNMISTTDSSHIHYLRQALKRDFIHKSSQHFADTGIRLCDIFPKDCPIFQDWYHLDTSKAYSMLQYLEGCFLITEILSRKNCLQQEEIEIVFALPNDEIKYYFDESNSFKNDLTSLLSDYNVNIKVHFLSFPYSTQTEHRPYNAPGEILKRNHLSAEDILLI